MALTHCLPLILHKRLVEFRSFMHDGGDHFSPLGCISDVWSARGKLLFFLDLDPFPWRIAQHDIEAARPACLLIFGYFILYRDAKDVGKCEMPVKKLVKINECSDILTQ
jgi:hypothetical protein